MAHDPRKQRTRQHVIAALSVHHAEGFILEEGHTVQRLGSDYGYDMIMNTFDEAGYAEPGRIYFQFKAAESLTAIGSAYVFDMDIRAKTRGFESPRCQNNSKPESKNAQA